MLAVGFSITPWGRSPDTRLASTPFPAPGAGSLQWHQEGTGAAQHWEQCVPVLLLHPRLPGWGQRAGQMGCAAQGSGELPGELVKPLLSSNTSPITQG